MNKAHGGLGWVNRIDNRMIESVDQKYGVRCETDTLKRVLLRKPGAEIEGVLDPESVLWNNSINVNIAREQFERMVEIYLKYGVMIDYITDIEALNYPNIYFVRDTFTMTPDGAIISRMASPIRAGEELIVQKTLSNINVPIISAGFGNMIFEGPDIMLINTDLAFIGVGLRTNMSAANYIKRLLTEQGYSEVIILQTTYGCGHLDGVVNILNNKYAVVVSKRFSYVGYEALIKHGFNVIELEAQKEIDSNMAINFVSLNKDTIIINEKAKSSIKKYEKIGVKCETVNVSELMNGGGSVHCMTGVIHREKV